MAGLSHSYSRADDTKRVTVDVVASSDQVWTIEADELYERLETLKPLGRHLVRRIHLLDLFSDVALVLGVIAPFMGLIWLLPLCLAYAVLQRYGNRRLVGDMAARAAQESTDAFLYLYNNGHMWLRRDPTNLS
ncbi:MAG: hypothetical protein AAGF20_02630 [Pseudomonadota bacterium]